MQSLISTESVGSHSEDLVAGAQTEQDIKEEEAFKEGKQVEECKSWAARIKEKIPPMTCSII